MRYFKNSRSPLTVVSSSVFFSNLGSEDSEYFTLITLNNTLYLLLATKTLKSKISAPWKDSVDERVGQLMWTGYHVGKIELRVLGVYSIIHLV